MKLELNEDTEPGHSANILLWPVGFRTLMVGRSPLFSVDWFEVHVLSTVNETQLHFFETKSYVNFFSRPFKFESKVQFVRERELCLRV